MRKDVDLVLDSRGRAASGHRDRRRLLQVCVDAGMGDLDFSVLVPICAIASSTNLNDRRPSKVDEGA